MILQAPPGAGKTTRVPLALLGELAGETAIDGKILLIEPRRLAARAAAARLAHCLGEPIGERVGYSVRNEQKRSSKTRLEAITDGLFLRRLQAQPDLPGVACVIFDEFHERRRDSDLALALLREARDLLRPDLTVLLMSATLQLGELSQQFQGARTLCSEGRSFPVDTLHCPRRNQESLEQHVFRALEEELPYLENERLNSNRPPVVLVFLPGLKEIDRCLRRIRGSNRLKAWETVPLHGQLSLNQQAHALQPCSATWDGRVVLATSIAESSLTLDGVRLVIDAGLSRHTRFDPGTGMEGLETVPSSQASADQRRGRAGRQAPGRCIRLWSPAEQQRRPLQDLPELQRADPQPTLLDLARWGAGLGEELPWLEPPPQALFLEGREQLQQLGLIDPGGQITKEGRHVAMFGIHPRLGLLMIEARRWGVEQLGCDLAALLSERNPPGICSEGCDLLRRLQALRQSQRRDEATGSGVILQQSRQWQRELNKLSDIPRGTPPDKAWDLLAGLLVARAFPEWVALSRDQRQGQFLLRQGRGATLPDHDPLSHAEALAVAQLDLSGRDARIRLAIPMPKSWVVSLAETEGQWQEDVEWDDRQQRIRADRILSLGALVLKRQPCPQPSTDAISAVLLERIQSEGVALLPWTHRSEQLRRRLQLAHLRIGTPWPCRDKAFLQANPDLWLKEASVESRSWRELDEAMLIQALWGTIEWDLRRQLDERLPTTIRIPSGRDAQLTYEEEEVVLAVKLQEMFGCIESPHLLNGDLPITLVLLSPAGRPLQRTRDLQGFWSGSYHEVRKEMRGRYPKHPWPESPTDAVATRKTKKTS